MMELVGHFLPERHFDAFGPSTAFQKFAAVVFLPVLLILYLAALTGLFLIPMAVVVAANGTRNAGLSVHRLSRLWLPVLIGVVAAVLFWRKRFRVWRHRACVRRYRQPPEGRKELA